jgi:hypothetical protein
MTWNKQHISDLKDAKDAQLYAVANYSLMPNVKCQNSIAKQPLINTIIFRIVITNVVITELFTVLAMFVLLQSMMKKAESSFCDCSWVSPLCCSLLLFRWAAPVVSRSADVYSNQSLLWSVYVRSISNRRRRLHSPAEDHILSRMRITRRYNIGNRTLFNKHTHTYTDTYT